MSLQKIHLRKLLLLFDASPKVRRRLLLEDIAASARRDFRRSEGLKDEGGDFYAPFWADAKKHAAGVLDLREATKERIELNYRRKRLYPLLQEAFLRWWDEKRRWRNEPFEVIPQNVKAQFPISDLESIIKVEGLLAVRVGGEYNRVVYPYFCEVPALSPDSARIGLWVLGKALRNLPQEDMRVLDLFRSTSVGVRDLPLRGDERRRLIANYGAVLEEWENLKKG